MKKFIICCLLSVLVFSCISKTDKAIHKLESFTSKWYDKAKSNTLTPEEKKEIVAELKSFDAFKDITKNDYSEEQIKKVSALNNKLLVITHSVVTTLLDDVN